MRSEAAERQYGYYFDELSRVAFEEAMVGRTTSHQAEMEAEKAASIGAFRLMCQENLWFLGTEVFGLHNAVIGGRKLLCERLHGPMVDELQKDESSLIWMSRHMLKTTWGAVWCVQRILQDPANVSILLGSMTGGRARSILRTIKGMLMNPQLVEAFGDWLIVNRRKWTKDDVDALTVTREVPNPDGTFRQIPQDGQQIEVFGMDKVVIGLHPTDIYLDDVITDKNTTTEVQLMKAIDNFSAISSLKGITTIMKIIGTPWHELDLYHYLIDNHVIHKNNQIRIAGAHMEGSKEVIDYPWYTRKFLDQQKREMRHLYWPQIHLDTRPREDRMFIPPYPRWSEETFPEDPIYYIGCDPATGLGEDEAGIAVGAVSRSNPSALFLVEACGHKVLSEVLAGLLVDRIEQYAPQRLGVEWGQQAALDPLIRLNAQERMRKGATIRMPEPWDVKTGGGEYGQKKWQKIDGTVGALIRDKRLLLRPGMTRLEYQMGAFDRHRQKNQDDILDAVMILIRTIPYFSYNHFHEMGVPVAQKLTWKGLFKGKSKSSERERVFAN